MDSDINTKKITNMIHLMMSRLLDGAQAGDPRYQIAWNNKNHQCHALS